MNNYGVQLGNTGPTPQMESNLSNFTNGAVEASETLLYRLGNLRDRLNGSGGVPESSTKPPQPSGVVAMTSTIHSNMHVAHKLMDEIDQLIG